MSSHGSNVLANRKIAILATNGFEQSELENPLNTLKDAGAVVYVVAPDGDTIQGMKHDKKGDSFKVDIKLESADPHDFDALILPGGVANPDSLRTNKKALSFIQSFSTTDKCIAAICHGPQLLINAEVIKGRKMTSVEAIRKDLENAGAQWEDKEVIVDGNLITSRVPKDLDAFNHAITEMLRKGEHTRKAA